MLAAGDAGQVVSQAVLTAGKPVGDVLFGIDNTLLCRGLVNNLFTPYASPALADVPDALELDPSHRATPIDVGDVCLNYSKAAFAGKTPPSSLDDLTKPELKDTFVTQNPETSSPGLAFLLATIAKYGEKGYEGYWKKLRANGVEVTSGWTEAYNESFGAGKGPRSVVTSYATSPAADLMFADPPVSEPTIGVIEDSCFRQIEFAGILAGTSNRLGAAKLVDFLLSRTFQEDIPGNMFVFPANEKAELPKEFKSIKLGAMGSDAGEASFTGPELTEDTKGRRWLLYIEGPANKGHLRMAPLGIDLQPMGRTFPVTDGEVYVSEARLVALPGGKLVVVYIRDKEGKTELVTENLDCQVTK